MELIAAEKLRALPRRLGLFDIKPKLPLEAIELGLCPSLLVSGGALIWGGPFLDAVLEDGKADLERILLPVEKIELNAAQELLAVLEREGRAGAYSQSECIAVGRAVLVASRDMEMAMATQFMREVSLLSLGAAGLAGIIGRLDALPEKRRALVENGIVDLKTAERCKSLPEEAAAAFPALAAHLSASERRLALGWINDIALGQGLSGAETAELVLRAARSAEEPLSAVRARRYPELSGMEMDFARIVSDRLAGSGVRLEPPPNFEGRGFKLSFEFSSETELAKKLKAAAALVPSADELMGLIN